MKQKILAAVCALALCAALVPAGFCFLMEMMTVASCDSLPLLSAARKPK